MATSNNVACAHARMPERLCILTALRALSSRQRSLPQSLCVNERRLIPTEIEHRRPSRPCECMHHHLHRALLTISRGIGEGGMVAVFKAAMKSKGIRWSRHQWERLQSLAGQTRAGWVTVTGRFNSLPPQSHCLPARFPFFLSLILSVSLMCPSFFFLMCNTPPPRPFS